MSHSGLFAFSLAARRLWEAEDDRLLGFVTVCLFDPVGVGFERGPEVLLPDDRKCDDETEAFLRRDDRKTRTERFAAKVAPAWDCVVRPLARGGLLID